MLCDLLLYQHCWLNARPRLEKERRMNELEHHVNKVLEREKNLGECSSLHALLYPASLITPAEQTRLKILEFISRLTLALDDLQEAGPL